MRIRILRSLLSFIILPGIMAGVLPWYIVRGRSLDHDTLIPGVVVFLVGLVQLILCVREFHVVGKGTLAPWDPPKSLVVTGPFTVVRNPMYVGVLTILAGWSLAFGSVNMVLYLLIFALAFHLRVVLYEEPQAKRQFGAAWVVYRSSVPRWIPRIGAHRKLQ